MTAESNCKKGIVKIVFADDEHDEILREDYNINQSHKPSVEITTKKIKRSHTSEILVYEDVWGCKMHLRGPNFPKIAFLLPPEISGINKITTKNGEFS